MVEGLSTGTKLPGFSCASALAKWMTLGKFLIILCPIFLSYTMEITAVLTSEHWWED
jgi:hypothetical protein